MAGWWDAIPALTQAAGAAAGYKQQNDLGNQALGVQNTAYQTALGQLGNTSYTPAQAQGVGPSAMNTVQPDAAAVNAERQVLQELMQASKEGYNIVDKAAVNALMQDVEQRTRGSRDAALASAQPGSGQAIAARLTAQASGADQANNKALQIAAGSRAKALDAMTQAGVLSGNIRNQSFNEGAQKAQAQDAISKFNSQVGQFNANAMNQGAEANIQNRQNAVNGLSGPANSYANQLNQQGTNHAQQSLATGGMVGNGAAALGQGITGPGQTPTPTTANNLTTLSTANNDPLAVGGLDPSAHQYNPTDPDDWQNWGNG